MEYPYYHSTLSLKEVLCDLLNQKPFENQDMLIIVKRIPDLFCNSYQDMVCRVFFSESKLFFVKTFAIFKKYIHSGMN